MKTVITIYALLASVFSFASDDFQKGTYGNGDRECQVKISSGNVLRTGRDMFVADMPETKLTPWGAVLTQELDKAAELKSKYGYIDAENGAGLGSFVYARFFFEGTKVSSFEMMKSSRDGQQIGRVHICENLKLID